jgi:hypothetical protein
VRKEKKLPLQREFDGHLPLDLLGLLQRQVAICGVEVQDPINQFLVVINFGLARLAAWSPEP